jgi:hypothetical protein
MPARVGERHCNGFGSQFSGITQRQTRNNLILPANQETASAIQHHGTADISINGKRTFKITREQHFKWVRKLGTTRTRACKEYKKFTI